MSFYKNFGNLSSWGRNLVLPAEKIKAVLCEKFFGKNKKVDRVIDFGAGTLYWSKFFAEKLENPKNIFPVDEIFDNNSSQNNMTLYSSLDNIPNLFKGGGYRYLFFICDVIHHLSLKEWDYVKEFAYKCDYVVIKDIDCRYRFKNFMNRLHDRIINGEKIRDVNPKILISELSRSGYNTDFYEFHKLWYSHFLLIGKKI